MVYKRYIKRKGKVFGPYYYESYRDEKGRTKTKLVSPPKKNTLKGINKFSVKLIYVLIVLFLVLTVSFLVLSSKKTFDSNLESLSDDNSVKISLKDSKIIGNIIKLIGFGVSQGDDSPRDDSPRDDPAVPSAEPPAVPSEDEPFAESGSGEETESSPDENIIEQQEIIETPAEDSAETIETEAETQTSENISKISPETSQVEQNISEINQTTPQLPPESVTAQENISSSNETSQNHQQGWQDISEINQIISGNLTISELNQTIQGENFTINENLIQYEAKLGQPVKWKKTLKIDAGENEVVNNLEVTLPKTAGEVSVKKIFVNNSVEELKVTVKNEKIVEETAPIISITGQAVKNGEKNNIFRKIFKFFRNFFTLIGKVIDIGENEENVLVNIQEELEDQEEIEIEYYTEAPYSEEIVFNENHKKVNIVGSEEVHYENILAFSNLSKEVSSKEQINLYWFINNSKVLIDFTVYDKNNNELIDYIEWSVPSLSNQTYELILITKAQHLDSNRNFISDIYEEVKALDGNWSEQINDSEYVRVTFEKNLTNQNDITIFPRTVNGTPKIEVYESPRDDSGEPNNKTEIIAEFTKITDNKYNKVYLTKLNGTQDTFDLKILGGSVEFEHIIDPFSGSGAGTLANPYQISNCTQLQEMQDGKTAHYKLVNNIDCSDTINWNGGAGFSPVGTANNEAYFKGSLQGDDYNITELYIKNSTAIYVGLFGYAVNVTINEVHLWNVYVEGSYTGGSAISVGGLVGSFDDNGTISNSSVHGNVTSKGIGNSYAGGLAGWVFDSRTSGKVLGSGLPGITTVYNSSFTGNISARGNAGTGGLVGWSDGLINYSYADVKLNTTGNQNVGGLVGINEVDGGDTGIIDNSYSKGNVSAAGTSIRIGGLVGDNNANIYHSYSTVNVSGRDNVGGLTGENAGIILNSYSCGKVGGGDAEPGGSGAGGAIGFAASAGKTNYTYSAGIVNGVSLVGGFVGQDGTGAGGPSYYNFSFYDYEVDGGNYNDTGDNGNVSGIHANTTTQMKKQSTYTALGWDFTNIWKIAEDYSYPYFKWQTTPACGLPLPLSTPPITGGSENSPEIIALSQGFDVAPKTMSVILEPGETKTECFTVTNTGWVNIQTSLNVLGQIISFTTLTNSVLSVPVGNSKSACAIFSADPLDISKNYTGQIEVSAKQKKYIDVELEIINITTINITTGLLPIGPLLPSGPIGILPIGSFPSGILPVGALFPYPSGPFGILPIAPAHPIEDVLVKIAKGVGVLFLWIILLLILIAYLAIKRYVALENQLKGYESREEKFAALERLEKNSSRKDVNFFERIVDKGAIYLAEKALEPKPLEPKPIAESLPINVREAYNAGFELYYNKDYDNALKEFQKAVAIKKDFWQGYEGIGACSFAKGNIEEANRAFEKSLSINPHNKELIEWMKKHRGR